MGDNGIITKSQDATFRTEISKVREQVNFKLAQSRIENKTLGEYFEQPTQDEAKDWAKTLKKEIIEFGGAIEDESITELKQDYIESNGLFDINNLYYVDKELVEGKEKMYLYDKKGDIVFKVPSTRVGLKVVHSIEALDGKSKSNSQEEQFSVIQGESNLVTVGNTVCYEPDLNGFVKQKTSILYYKTNSDGSVDSIPVEVSAEEYLMQKDRVITRNETDYEFYNYKKIAESNPKYDSIWANIKVEGGGIETNWVWVPRYAYKISGNNILIEYIDINDNVAGTNFKIGEAEEYNDYTVHSEFLGNSKKGIWVSKYEVSKVN